MKTLALLLSMPLLLPAYAEPHRIATLQFLSGCWEGDAGPQGQLEEIFTTPSQNMILGLARVNVQGQTVWHELSRISQEQDKLTYTGHVDGESTVTLTSTMIAANSVTFENASLDFPKLIQYAWVEPHLKIVVSGEENGKPSKLEFKLSRCAK